jgi:hypothetical protein
MTTLGQIDYETCNHRNPDAVPWDLLDPDTRRARERGACEVALRVEPTIVMLRAECDQQRALLSEVLSDFRRIVNGNRVATADAATYDRWLKLAGIEGP